MLRIRWPVFVALAVALLAPSPALADEVNPLDGLTGGFNDLVSGEAREVESDPVRDYDYEPSLRAGDGETATLPEEGTEIQTVMNAVNKNPFGSTASFGTDLLGGIRQLAGSTNRQWFLIPAVGLTFFWWGLRKAKNIIMAAWHGRARV